MRRIAERLGLVVALVALALAAGVSPAVAGVVGWSLHSVAEPWQFSASDPPPSECVGEKNGSEQVLACDRYQLVVANVGSEPSNGPVTVTDTLPAGIVATGWASSPFGGSLGASGGATEGSWSCSIEGSGSSVTCTYEGEPIPAGANAPWVYVMVAPPAVGVSGPLRNVVSVEGGGASAPVAVSQETPVGPGVLPFGVSEFGFEPDVVGGAPATQAGGHPWTVTTNIQTPTHTTVAEFPGPFVPAENPKNIVVELPLGLLGNPQTVAQCTTTQLSNNSCPQASVVGSIAIGQGSGTSGEYEFSGQSESQIFNMVPEGGYPAEFGFGVAGRRIPVYLFASVVRGASGYRLRVASTAIPPTLTVHGLFTTFFGVPGQVNGTGSTAAFLDNPADCTAGGVSSRLQLEGWEAPGQVFSKEATAYQQIMGCDQLHFEPSLSFLPSADGEGSTQADEPSGFTTDVKVPQTTDSSELATPPLKTATVTLPAGVSVSPSAADGLQGCQAEGPEGINIGSSNIGPAGEDLGDPMATELGEGHGGPGGNGSLYDDSLYHVAPGHCPLASQIGTVEVSTPVLPEGPGGAAPLQGSVYLAAPKCGGAGQPACTTASASNGELFGIYLEAHGDGVILKIPGTVAADPQTGQLTATFKESPQQPFSDLKLHFKGGPRAPLANPQTCGQASTSALLEPWSAPETPSVTSTSSFNVDWNGSGGACPAGMPFSPAFEAGILTSAAGRFSPFTVTFSRQDREQDASGLTMNMPSGLSGLIAQIPLCGEAQAAAGTCDAASQIGSTTVASGAGPHPFWLSGRVYLTGPYKGAPFGLSIVTPADAGPFHLGNVVVRASIAVNSRTAALTVLSDPLPQIVDGVPLRLRTVSVNVDRPGFMFNPTNCTQQQITGTLSAAQGATAGVSSPFGVSGCASMPFKPTFGASTQASGRFAGNGASLDVKIAAHSGPTAQPGEEEANIAKVDVQLPKLLPARLTTLQKACTEGQFAANPAGCPAASDVGTVVAHTPVLPVALEGPAYLVSHGGAAFPDLVVVLQGDGVTIDLVGNTIIKQGITYSKFDTNPDAPISSFELKLPEGPHSALAATANLCSQPLLMPTIITGQNGAVFNQNTHIEVEGCPNSLSVLSAKVRKRTLTLSVTVPSAGKLTAGGKGLSTASKSAAGRETLTLTLHHKKAGRLRTKVKLSFAPARGSRLTKTLAVRFKR